MSLMPRGWDMYVEVELRVLPRLLLRGCNQYVCNITNPSVHEPLKSHT
jgi:hypothetical protein